MSAAFPPLYDRWLTAAFGQSIASEPRSTCNDCAMAPKAGEPAAERYFDSVVKCCTFHPDLPNFNVGGVLADGDSPAARHIGKRIKQGFGVTPWGLHVPTVYRTLYNETIKGGTAQGRHRALRCPFYIDAGGLCGVHQHRDATCSTWFCKGDHGVLGRSRWMVLRKLVQKLERSVLLHCVLALGIDRPALANLMLNDPLARPLDAGELDPDRARNADEDRRTWGRWLGREREFFVACAEIAQRLEWRDVMAMAGSEAAALIQLARELERAYSELPREVATCNGGTLIQLSPRPGTARLRHPSTHHDWADVPAAVLRVLPRLTGRPLAEAMAMLRQEGVAIDERTVQTLVDYQLLAPRDPA
jgi:hypothetical protein